MDWFTSAQAVRITGISKDMLHYLCRAGLVVPSVSRRRGSKGHGVARQYGFADLVLFKVVKRLCESGVSPLKVKKAIREVHRIGLLLGSVPASHLVIFENNVYRWDGRGNPFRMTDGQQAFGFILDLASITSELEGEIRLLAA